MGIRRMEERTTATGGSGLAAVVLLTASLLAIAGSVAWFDAGRSPRQSAASQDGGTSDAWIAGTAAPVAAGAGATLPRLSFISGGWSREGEPPTSSGTGVIVRLAGVAPEGGASVRLQAVSGTATVGQDFLPFDVTLHIPAGATEATTTEVLWILGDDLIEGDETFYVVASEPLGMSIDEDVRGTIEIGDDDPLPNAVRDINRDGASDLLWHSRLAGRMRWHLVQDTMPGAAEEQLVGFRFRPTAVDDMDSDGDVDIVWEDDAQPILLYWRRDTLPRPWNDEAFRAEVMEDAHPGSGWRAVATVDLGYYYTGRTVWMDDAGARLRLMHMQEYAVPPGHMLAAVGDFDGDAVDDLLWSTGAPGEWRVWRGQEGQGFVSSESFEAEAARGSMFAADWNGDARDELFSYDGTTGALRWWIIDGQPMLAGEQAVPPGLGLVAVGDYDADGRSDLLWRDAARRHLWFGLSRPNGFVEQGVGDHPGGDWAPLPSGLPDQLTGAGGNGGVVHVVDVNGDGTDDLVWHDPVNRRLDWWWMREGTRVGLLGRDSVPMALLATGEFDGLPGADALWQSRTGSLWLDAVDGPGTGARRLPSPPAEGWRLAGTGDLDGDGDGDLLWLDLRSRQLAWWLLDGTAAPRMATVELPEGYRFVAMGDLDGSGSVDVVWRDLARDEVVLARLEAGTWDTAVIGPSPAGDATPLAADLDGDGWTDLLWHDAERAQLKWWRMAGATRAGTRMKAVPDGYSLVGIADLDGDGADSVLWRDHARGELRAWAGGTFEERRVAEYPGLDIEVPPMVEEPLR